MKQRKAELRPCPYQFNQLARSLSSAGPKETAIPFSIVPHMAFHFTAPLAFSDVLMTYHMPYVLSFSSLCRCNNNLSVHSKTI